MDRGNVGMIESGLKLDLAKESLILLGSLRCVRRDDLHRFHAPCDCMLDLVDFSHTTAAKPFNDSVSAYCVANLETHHTPATS